MPPLRAPRPPHPLQGHQQQPAGGRRLKRAAQHAQHSPPKASSPLKKPGGSRGVRVTIASRTVSVTSRCVTVSHRATASAARGGAKLTVTSRSVTSSRTVVTTTSRAAGGGGGGGGGGRAQDAKASRRAAVALSRTMKAATTKGRGKVAALRARYEQIWAIEAAAPCDEEAAQQAASSARAAEALDVCRGKVAAVQPRIKELLVAPRGSDRGSSDECGGSKVSELRHHLEDMIAEAARARTAARAAASLHNCAPGCDLQGLSSDAAAGRPDGLEAALTEVCSAIEAGAGTAILHVRPRPLGVAAAAAGWP